MLECYSLVVLNVVRSCVEGVFVDHGECGEKWC